MKESEPPTFTQVLSGSRRLELAVARERRVTGRHRDLAFPNAAEMVGKSGSD